MSVTAKQRAEQAVQEPARSNYREMARLNAARDGISETAALAALVKWFKAQDEALPGAGWNHLAVFFADDDPTDTSAAQAEARAVNREDASIAQDANYLKHKADAEKAQADREAANNAATEAAEAPAEEPEPPKPARKRATAKK